MGARRGRSTDTALELLTEQMHTVWGQGTDKVATLLSMDVAEAFDTVSHERLIHDLRKRKIPIWITNWTESFLKERNTTMTINGRYTTAFRVRTGIPQGSSISPILYLFYNADLLDICERPETKVNDLGFVDDVNMLTYGSSTEENCKTLESLHRKCEAWALRHEAVFAPAKYQLIHLSRNPKKFNMQANVNIANTAITSKTDIRALELQIDTALRWGPHIRKVQENMTKQSLALSKITSSTWGATFARARRVYTAVVRPAMTYESTVWHTPKDLKGSKAIERKLTIIQNRCLRTIAGAYRATPISVLEAEIYVPPIPILLNRLQRNARRRMKHSSRHVRKSCNVIVKKLKGTRGRRRAAASTPGGLKATWAIIPTESKREPPPIPTPPWKDLSEEQKASIEEFAAGIKTHTKATKKLQKKEWQTSWTRYTEALSKTPTVAQQLSISKNRLKSHSLLTKAESSLATQIRTEKIGLADFLHRRKVPGITCPCGWPRQTSRHVIMNCNLHDNRDNILAESIQGYQDLISNPKKAKVVTAWLMMTGILPQFNLAMQQLQE